jgi:hypothetical protein
MEVYMFVRKGLCAYMVKVICFVFLFSTYSLANGTEKIDPKFIPFMLNESDMPGYTPRLFGEDAYYRNHWSLSDTQIIRTVVQSWRHVDEKENHIWYELCIYDSEIQAHNGIFRHLTFGLSAGFIWGSPSGSIVGDKSWTSVSRRTIAFVRGNVGVKIGVVSSDDQFIQKTIDTISQKFLTKIERNLSPEIAAKIEELKKNQISESKYNTLLADVIGTDLKEFSLLRQIDSKWSGGIEEFDLARKVFDPKDPYRALGRSLRGIESMPAADRLELGRRSEWQNEQGMVIGIDICEFTSEEIAENAARRRVYESDAYFADNPLDPQIPTIRWWMISASIVYVKNKTAVHIYQFNKQNYAEVDLDFFAKGTKKIAEGISNIE